MSMQPNPGPGRKRDEQLTQRVVEAAHASLAEDGFERLSLEGVARRAGVSRTAIYKRWPSLADLLLDVAVHTFDTLGLPRDTLVMRPPDTGTLAGDLHAFVSEGMHRLAVLDDAGVARPLLAESILDPTLGARVRAALFPDDEAVFMAILDVAVARKEIEPPGEGAEHLFQTLIGYGIFRAYLLHVPLHDGGIQYVSGAIARALVR